LLHIGQPQRGQRGRLAAMGAVLQLQQLRNLVEAEAQLL
jgi:hypothetical protein